MRSLVEGGAFCFHDALYGNHRGSRRLRDLQRRVFGVNHTYLGEAAKRTFHAAFASLSPVLLGSGFLPAGHIHDS